MRAPVGERGLAAPDAHREQAAPAAQRALAVRRGDVRAVREAEGQHPVDPAFEDRRRREPPQRELEHHRVRPAQLLLLGGDVGREPPRAGGRVLGAEHPEPGFRRVVGEVVGVEGGVPLHRVQVGDLHLVPGGAQPGDREVAQRGGERAGLGVGGDDQDAPGPLLLRGVVAHGSSLAGAAGRSQVPAVPADSGSW